MASNNIMNKTKNVIITGANGYIGNCLFHYLKRKYKIIGIDKEKSSNKNILQCNILDEKKLDLIIKKNKPEIIIHLAAQSLVDETINKKKYYNNNTLATNSLLKVMKNNKIRKIIFSSTAAVYKQSVNSLTEKSKLKALSTYAKTKLICEKNIQKEKEIKSVILRFFNVCSALDKPIIGEFHNPETHLIPTIVYKAMFNKKIYIYGNDFPTPDGTCVRDYIHIKDICDAIEKSTKYLINDKKSTIFNIGSHKGLSNNEIVNYIKKTIKNKINLSYVNRRKGDVSRLICNSNHIYKTLNWKAKNSNLKKIITNEIIWIKKFKKKGLSRSFKNYLK
jgi:UDP-glucose 4-epimerase